MDEEKARLLFGEVPAGVDVDDPDERAMFFEGADPYEKRPAWGALQSVIANQVADDTPAEVWQVARDLVARGIDRVEVLEQLTLNLDFFTRRILAEETGFDEAAYVAALRRLPLPDPNEAATAVEEAVLACQGIESDRVVDLVLAGLAREPDDILTEHLVGHLLDDLIDEGGPLALLAGDRMVHVGDLTAGTVMTHHLSEAEARPGMITATVDPAPFARGNEVAHEQSVWDNQEATRRIWRIMDHLDSREERAAALAALEAAANEGADAAALRAVLKGLQTPEVLSVVADELLGSDDSEEAIESAGRFARRLLQAAKRPPEIAVARWLACVVAERRRDPVAAEGHLRIALNAAPGWAPVVDRAAWYASDRGDARGAAMLWRSLDADDIPDLEMVEQFEDTPRRLLARNEPCWCGSGRKYKNCHLQRPDLPPLPDRVAWIWRKAAAFLERRGGAADLALVDYAHGRVVDPDDEDDIFEVLDDPIVIDCALTEGGWFQRFLDERGALLPQAEAMLVTAWMLVKRSVYEIADVRPGTGVTVRDIATGNRLEVRARTFSEEVRLGELICARVVPDGESHQFIGGTVPVAPGRELDILALCEDGKGYEL